MLDEIVLLNYKYIKTKLNCKLKAKFFTFFKVLYLIGKQTNKSKLLKKQRIYPIFYILLIKQDSIKRVNESNIVIIKTR